MRDAANSIEQLQIIRMRCPDVAAVLHCLGELTQVPRYTRARQTYTCQKMHGS
jgi:hypothetical protein